MIVIIWIVKKRNKIIGIHQTLSKRLLNLTKRVVISTTSTNMLGKHLTSTKIKVRYLAEGVNAPYRANEHLLKQYWRHINNFYFRKIEQPEF